jgi:hypothetical protein
LNRDEQDARIALLQHYSSKSTNQGVMILTSAILLFAFFQATSELSKFAPNLNTTEIEISSAMFFWLVLSFLLRSMGRLILWGELAGAALYAKMLSEKEVSNTIPSRLYDELKKESNKRNISFPEPVYTDLIRLSVACRIYAQCSIRSRSNYNISKWFYRMSKGYWLRVISFLLMVFLLRFVFYPMDDVFGQHLVYGILISAFIVLVFSLWSLSEKPFVKV